MLAATQPAQLSEIISTLRRRRRLLIWCALAGAVLGLVAWLLIPARYSASAAVSISPISTTLLTSTQDAEQTVNIATESQIVSSRGIAVDAARSMDDDVTPESVQASTSVENPAESLVLRISYSADSPERAAEGADAVAAAYLTARREAAVDQVQRLRLAATKQVQALEVSAARNDSEIAQRALRIQADTLGTRIAELSNIDPNPGQVLGAAEVPADRATLGLVPLGVGGTFLGLLVGIPLALTRKEREDGTEIGDVDVLTSHSDHMVLDGTKDADRSETWDIAALMLKIPRDIPADSSFTVMVDAGPAMGDAAPGLQLVEALKRRGRTAQFVDAATVNEGKISRGWPTDKKRESWGGEIVVIDSTAISSDANKVALGTRADSVLLARSTTDDAAALRRLTGLLRSEGVNVALTMLFPDRPELISLTR